MKIFQRALLLFLVAIMVLQSTSKTAVAVYWSLNQNWIAKNLCEKRLEKKSCCEGSCQLKKWTAAETGGPQGQPAFPNLLLLKDSDSFFEPGNAFALPVFFEKEERPARFWADDRLPRAPFLEAIGMPPDAAA